MTRKTFDIGTTADGAPLGCELSRLIASRMLVQASSGGGKSRLLRRLAEQAAPHVQTFAIDPEGEFQTLREKLDMVLVGHGGEVPAAAQSAATVARRLMELNVSAVMDLSELHRHDWRAFVGETQRRMIDVVRSNPVLGREKLAETLGYHPRSKGFTNSVGRLRTMGVIDYPHRGEVALSDVFRV